VHIWPPLLFKHLLSDMFLLPQDRTLFLDKERTMDNVQKHNICNPRQVKGRSWPYAYLFKHYAMKTYGGVVVYLHFFLTSALDGVEWLDSCPYRFTPRGRVSRIHWIGGWVGPRFLLDAMDKRKIWQCCETNPGSPARSISLYRLSYPDSFLRLSFINHML
jgi:hypothetical protein